MKFGNRVNKPVIYFVSIALVISLGASVTWAFSVNKGQIVDGKSAKQPVTPTFREFSGKYVAFRYEGSYQSHALSAKDNDLELYMLNADTTYDKHVAVLVSTLDSGRLDHNSAYLLRNSQPTVYSGRQVPVSDGTATVWTKSDGQEQTAFIARGDKVAILSFTSAANTEQLRPEVDALLQTFRWKDL